MNGNPYSLFLTLNKFISPFIINQLFSSYTIKLGDNPTDFISVLEFVINYLIVFAICRLVALNLRHFNPKPSKLHFYNTHRPELYDLAVRNWQISTEVSIVLVTGVIQFIFISLISMVQIGLFIYSQFQFTNIVLDRLLFSYLLLFNYSAFIWYGEIWLYDRENNIRTKLSEKIIAVILLVMLIAGILYNR